MKARLNYRCYPNKEQKKALAQLFGCVRVVWNDALAFSDQEFRENRPKPKNSELQKKFITQAKKTEERKWLAEVSVVPLQQSLNDLDQAFNNFFKSVKGERKGQKIKPPRFKKKHSKQTARFSQRGFSLKNNKVYLAKIGDLKTVWSRPLPSEPSSVTIIKDSSDRYFLSFVVEIEPEKIPNPVSEGVGVDLGLITFATLSTGEKIKAPKPLRKNLKKLRKLSQKLSKKQKGSNRRNRARKRLARLHAKIQDTRIDFLHKLSTRLIRENQVVVLEDLNTSGMVKNRKLARSINDAGWQKFRDLLTGKAEKYGHEIRIIARWFPSSKQCPDCHQKIGKLDLSVREWICLNCGKTQDRDVAASRNIKVAGGLSETQNGHGGKQKTTTAVAAPYEVSTDRLNRPFAKVQI